MVSSEILHPSALSVADLACWRELAQANPAFHNPLLGPDFAQAVGAVRPDARVAVFRQDGRAIGFLPFQRRPGGVAKPIGAPLGDYQALVCGPDFPLQLAEALKLAGLVSLYAGETLAAVHFGVRLGDYFHPWIASANPALSSYSPGQIFLWRAIGAMPDAKLTVYDMGPSHDHYKRHYCLDEPIQVGVGMVQAHSTGGALAGLGEAAWVLVGGDGEGFAARLRRRLDIIDSVETTLPGRVRGLTEAVLMQARRKPIPDYALGP